MYPFEVDLSWNPSSLMDLPSWKTDSSITSVNDLKLRLKPELDDARFSHQFAQARESTYFAQKYVPVTYQVGQKVWITRILFCDAVSRSQKSSKLGVKRFGPFRITKLIGRNAVTLELHSNVRINLLIQVLHTTSHYENSPDIQELLCDSSLCQMFQGTSCSKLTRSSNIVNGVEGTSD